MIFKRLPMAMTMLLIGTVCGSEMNSEDGVIVAERIIGGRRQRNRNEGRTVDDLSRLVTEFGGVHAARLLKDLRGLTTGRSNQGRGLITPDVLSSLSGITSGLGTAGIDFNAVSRVFKEMERRGLGRDEMMKVGEDVMTAVRKMEKERGNREGAGDSNVFSLRENQEGARGGSGLVKISEEEFFRILQLARSGDKNAVERLANEVLRPRTKETGKNEERRNFRNRVTERPGDVVNDLGQLTDEGINALNTSHLLDILDRLEKIEARSRGEGNNGFNTGLAGGNAGLGLVQEGTGAALGFGVGSLFTLVGLSTFAAAANLAQASQDLMVLNGRNGPLRTRENLNNNRGEFIQSPSPGNTRNVQELRPESKFNGAIESNGRVRTFDSLLNGSNGQVRTRERINNNRGQFVQSASHGNTKHVQKVRTENNFNGAIESNGRVRTFDSALNGGNGQLRTRGNLNNNREEFVQSTTHGNIRNVQEVRHENKFNGATESNGRVRTFDSALNGGNGQLRTRGNLNNNREEFVQSTTHGNIRNVQEVRHENKFNGATESNGRVRTFDSALNGGNGQLRTRGNLNNNREEFVQSTTHGNIRNVQEVRHENKFNGATESNGRVRTFDSALNGGNGQLRTRENLNNNREEFVQSTTHGNIRNVQEMRPENKFNIALESNGRIKTLDSALNVAENSNVGFMDLQEGTSRRVPNSFQRDEGFVAPPREDSESTTEKEKMLSRFEVTSMMDATFSDNIRTPSNPQNTQSDISSQSQTPIINTLPQNTQIVVDVTDFSQKSAGFEVTENPTNFHTSADITSTMASKDAPSTPATILESSSTRGDFDATGNSQTDKENIQNQIPLSSIFTNENLLRSSTISDGEGLASEPIAELRTPVTYTQGTGSIKDVNPYVRDYDNRGLGKPMVVIRDDNRSQPEPVVIQDDNSSQSKHVVMQDYNRDKSEPIVIIRGTQSSRAREYDSSGRHQGPLQINKAKLTNQFAASFLPAEILYRAAIRGEDPYFVFGLDSTESPSRPVVQRGIVQHLGSYPSLEEWKQISKTLRS